MEEIKVSILCLAYNHEQYIRKALDGFVNQETNFKFEVLINDDCSIDNTAKIIKEYEEKYPEIIKPIYQNENQYSKGIKIINDILMPLVKADYVAFCEGDDYWIDKNKLQIQYDYMVSHPNCTCCVHSFCINNYATNSIEHICRSEQDRDFTLKEIIDGGGGLFATNSLFIKTEVLKTMPICFRSKYFGDYQIPIYAAILGDVHYINAELSLYNMNIPNSWTVKNKSRDKNIEVNQAINDLLKTINKFYDNKYYDDFIDAINKNDVKLLYMQEKFKEVKQNKYYKEHCKEYPIKQRLVINVGSISVKVVRLIKEIRDLIK